MTDVIDRARQIRAGEELDIAAVETFLRNTVPGLEGELSIQQFPSGFSNLTYLITMGGQEMVLRKPPIGANIKSAHDMGREFRILSALRPVFPYCPRPIAYTEDTSVIGTPFFVMERISGIILRKDLPPGLAYSPEGARSLCRQLVDIQAELHAIDVKAAGLDFIGKPEGYVKRQVDGWSGRYRKAKTDDAPDFETVMAWLNAKMPPDTEHPTLVHNDYKFDNVVLDRNDPGRIIGILDWEMATYADPLMDLGNSLAYWIDRDDPEECHLIRQAPTTMEGAMTRQEILDRYSEKTGRATSGFDFYMCFGLFRLAGIAQQIYNRYYHGITRDKRFGMLIAAVQILERCALRLIDASRL
ncbi:MAG: phosphotransferase family protein [Pseudomonadota bacterium]